MRVGAGFLAVAVISVVLAACGSSDKGGSTSGGTGKAGGTINILGTSYPDFLDPALSYTVDGWEALSQVYPGLLTYEHKPGLAGAKVVPGLAEALPTVSKDGKTWDFTLRKGLKFSDGTPVKASDFKASIERLLKMDSQGSGLGFTNIVGGAEYLKSKKGGVTGITADDAAGTIKIELVKPRGDFAYQLGLPFAGVVPASTPAENQTKNPPPGTGRYAFKDVVVNRSYKLVANPNFSESLKGTAIDAGKAAGFNVTIDKQLATQVTKITNNTADFMIDNPPADRVAAIKAKYGGKRFEQFPTNSSFYFFLNSEVPPFDDVLVRQAANYAVDVNAINRIQGGVLSPANTILPPGVPGFKQAPDMYPFDLAKAKALIKQAGAEGKAVTVWGNDEEQTKNTVQYWADTLNQIGLKAKVKIVPAETYFTTIGDRKTGAQTGWANWFQDYPHPADFIDVLVNPEKVVATGNNNYSYNASDKELAARIDAAVAQPELTPAVIDQWTALDVEIQKKAYWAIYGNRKQSTFFSDRMDFQNCKGEHALWTHDWAEFCLK